MRIGIVGLGLMGGSIAAALKPHHPIHAFDIDPLAATFALAKGIIDHRAETPEALFEACDVIYLCLYPRAVAAFFEQHVGALRPGTICVDIAGVKAAIIDGIRAHLRKDIQFVFSHPVAGREKIGVAFADPNIFKGANYIVVPTPENTPEALETVRSLAREMGFGNVTDLSAEEHDAIIAYTSQLTHVISLSIVDSDDGQFETGRFIGDSYRDLTRIAMINAPLWSELFLENKKNLLFRIDAFRTSLDAFEAMLRNDDLDGLQQKMTEAKRRRSLLEKGK
ncbi:MAG: prephenate dehydrogenase [Bacillota bacterium]|nr:prephenate dehydrogenase [Bacillota bacterium]